MFKRILLVIGLGFILGALTKNAAAPGRAGGPGRP